jgi:hypothetical protein
MRSFRVTKNKAAVSYASQETAFNAGQSLDNSLFITEGDIPAMEYTREKNEGELTGMEEPTRIYYKGKTATANWTFDKATPSQILLCAAYAMGAVSTSAAGSGYEHTITPIDGDTDKRRSIPTFSQGYRYSDIEDVVFDGCAMDSITLTYAKGDKNEFLKASGSVKMSGKTTSNIERETITATENATTLTLSNAVDGDTDAGRLLNIQHVEYEHSNGYYAPVVCSAASDSTTAAVLTIAAPGSGSGAMDYRATYAKADASITFPALVEETPLKVSRTTVTIGGKWNGSAFVGGEEMACEAKNLEWNFQNGVAMEFCFGENNDYAGKVWRDARTQTLKVDREFRDAVHQKMLETEEYFGLHVITEGAIFSSPHKFTVELIFPRLAIVSAAVSADGKRLSESVDLAVFEDSTYGSVIMKVKCTMPTVAA